MKGIDNDGGKLFEIDMISTPQSVLRNQTYSIYKTIPDGLIAFLGTCLLVLTFFKKNYSNFSKVFLGIEIIRRCSMFSRDLSYWMNYDGRYVIMSFDMVSNFVTSYVHLLIALRYLLASKSV